MYHIDFQNLYKIDKIEIITKCCTERHELSG